jgi:hypothetical protein
MLVERGVFHLDPRLPLDAVGPIADAIAAGERAAYARLHLDVQRPETYVYIDKHELTAVGCINPEVSAYYDGMLHVVSGDADLRTSVIHEYAHHALMTSGLLGPAWAQEGIAMHVAGETWWQSRQWLAPLVEQPFGSDDLDSTIPYKLGPDQAVQFYAESAALVACVLEARHWNLQALFDALRRGAQGSPEEMTYYLPEVSRRSFVRSCLERWGR